jgi:hypothetical protein
LRHGRGVAHVAEQSRQEERERLHGNVDGEEAERTDGVVDVEDGTLDVHQLDLLVDVGTVLTEETLSSDGLLAFGKEFALVRVSLHEEGSDQGNDASEETLEEENVAPGVEFHGSDAELRNPDETGSQKTTESASKRTGRDEDTDAEKELVPLVEAGEEEGNTGHSATLSQTQECACNEKSGVALNEGSAERDQAEREHQEGDPESWSDCLEDDV